MISLLHITVKPIQYPYYAQNLKNLYFTNYIYFEINGSYNGNFSVTNPRLLNYRNTLIGVGHVVNTSTSELPVIGIYCYRFQDGLIRISTRTEYTEKPSRPTHLLKRSINKIRCSKFVWLSVHII